MGQGACRGAQGPLPERNPRGRSQGRSRARGHGSRSPSCRTGKGAARTSSKHRSCTRPAIKLDVGECQRVAGDAIRSRTLAVGQGSKQAKRSAPIKDSGSDPEGGGGTQEAPDGGRCRHCCRRCPRQCRRRRWSSSYSSSSPVGRKALRGLGQQDRVSFAGPQSFGRRCMDDGRRQWQGQDACSRACSGSYAHGIPRGQWIRSFHGKEAGA